MFAYKFSNDILRYISLYGGEKKLLIKKIKQLPEYKRVNAMEKAQLLEAIEDIVLKYKI